MLTTGCMACSYLLDCILAVLRQCACSLDAVCSNQAVHIAARYYVTMDILRRVLESHFHYHIMFVMNVTDIDDKIIKRARLKHLLSQHLQQTPDDSKASVRVPIDACWAGSWGWRVIMSPSWYDVCSSLLNTATGCDRSCVLGEGSSGGLTQAQGENLS